GRPPLVVGDLVDVVVVLPVDVPSGVPTGDGETGGAADDEADDPAFPLVERAAVVDVGEQAVTVAVPEDDSSRVAWAVTNGAVVLALTGA
ncbi:MAG TPA: hypothetical protein VJM49_08915, partial [Acidimicrobiales bacterium]|nr:hypothetical protein [Acidimicrobiales bacterium]